MNALLLLSCLSLLRAAQPLIDSQARFYLGQWTQHTNTTLFNIFQERAGKVLIGIRQSEESLMMDMQFYDGQYVDSNVVQILQLNVTSLAMQPSSLCSFQTNIRTSAMGSLYQQTAYQSKFWLTTSFLLCLEGASGLSMDMTLDSPVPPSSLKIKALLDTQSYTMRKVILVIMLSLVLWLKQKGLRLYRIALLNTLFVRHANLAYYSFLIASSQDIYYTMYFLDNLLQLKAFAIIPFLMSLGLIVEELQVLVQMWEFLFYRDNMTGPEIRHSLYCFVVRLYFQLLLCIMAMNYYQHRMGAELVVSAMLLPQVLQNIWHNRNCYFGLPYALGFFMSRTCLGLYQRCCPVNLFEFSQSALYGVMLGGGMVLQIAVLLSQVVLGPRWMIPKVCLPKPYDYLDSISLEGSERSSQLSQELLDRRQQVQDCAICMEKINNKKMQQQPQGHRGIIMKTPCKHQFHVECLTNWLKVKLECPVCRHPLPIYEQA